MACPRRRCFHFENGTPEFRGHIHGIAFETVAYYFHGAGQTLVLNRFSVLHGPDTDGDLAVRRSDHGRIRRKGVFDIEATYA